MYVHMTHINKGTHLIIEYVRTYIEMFTGTCMYVHIYWHKYIYGNKPYIHLYLRINETHVHTLTSEI